MKAWRRLGMSLIYILEGSRGPKNRPFSRSLGSVTGSSLKTSIILSKFFEKIDGRRSSFGWRAVCALCRKFSSSCCWNEMIDVFYEGGRKRGSVCSVRSDSNGRFRRSADVDWGNNPWRFWMLEFFTHKTSWQRSCSTQVCQTHFLVRPSAHNKHCGSINWI